MATREIPLTKGFVALVDEDDYEMVSKWKWSAHDMGPHVYALRHLRFGRKQKVVYLHQTLMLPGPNEEVDHRNHNTLDCRRSNMRVCTHAENSRNKIRGCDNTSGYIGVHWCSQKQRWHAEVLSDGRKHHGGFFLDPVDAARARDEIARRLHGDFAYLNEVAS